MVVRQYTNPGVHIDEVPSPPRVTASSTSVTAFVGRAARGPVDRPQLLRGDADSDRVLGAPGRDNPLGLALRDYFRHGGGHAVAVRSSSAEAGIAALDDASDLDPVSQVSLVVLVPEAPAGSVSPRAAAVAAQFCEQHGSMLLLDAPASWRTVDDVVGAAAAGFETTLGTTSRNAVVFFPRLLASRPSGDPRVVAPAVAGIYARTDTEHGVWKAPAGSDARLVGGSPAERLEDGDLDRLATVGVNGLREVAGAGTVVWGARTLAGRDDGEAEWRYVPVRRTALFLERSIHEGTAWAVFEPNGERLRGTLRRQVEEFLHGLWRDGAFAGSTAEKAFFVRCDATTTTRADLGRGLLNLQVGFAPLRPAEFVVLSLAVTTADAAGGPAAHEEQP